MSTELKNKLGLDELDITDTLSQTLNQLEGKGLSVGERGVALLLVENAKSYSIAVKSDIAALEKTMNAKFEAVNDKFASVNQRIDDVKNEMNGRFTEVNQRIDDVKNDMNIRFEAVDKQFLGVNQRINEVKNDIEEKMDTKINNLEKNIYRELAIMRKDFTNSNRILMASATLIFLLGVAFIPKVMAYLGM
ncbi:hypothetical protein [Borrelia sp. RT1S]|uniref:hypothetical protein n=1 Tax=Borrelia sp. RT1S TaxID=2898580 RepID=UPI001E57DFD7|nr:hypothetical protein [Borrelia sp. RT1S]UGQ17693.1 hypothetical protein LSO05_04515 [Borrelia sp. RT1S]UGQ17786.1 hypothetical protein LSO05_04990 [Borrelia sp. RT1S]